MPVRLLLGGLLLSCASIEASGEDDDPCAENLSPGIHLRSSDCGYEELEPRLCGIGDDDDSGDVPVGDDDDSALAACEPQAVVDPSCVDLEFEVQNIGALFNGCPPGDHVFGSQSTWQGFLAECQLSQDPIPDHDCTNEALVATVREETGCSPQARPLWFVLCDDGYHYGYGFRVCGDCQTRHFVAQFVTVQLWQLPVVVHDCLPDDMACP